MRSTDRRLLPARPDLAAAHLRGTVQAERFVEGVAKRVVDPIAPLRRAPAPDAPLDTEALFGETVTVYETTDEGWAWGQLELDGYVGWLPANALGDLGAAPTHRVNALRTFVFSEPDIKALPLMALPFASRLRIARERDGFAVTNEGGFIPLQHVVLFAHRQPDFVATARRFLGTPYLWGGRSPLGLDCSGLVQLALQAAGIDCPRDSDMQAKIGAEVAFKGDLSKLRCGDLVYWKGHIGLVADSGRLLHANAFHMAVAEELLTAAVDRIRASGLEILAVRRI
jgi:cell wall-associated NlpC family hydrolase